MKGDLKEQPASVMVKDGLRRSLNRWNKRHPDKVKVDDLELAQEEIEEPIKEGWGNLLSTLITAGSCVYAVLSYVDSKAIQFVLVATILSFTINSGYSFFKNK
jgi:hypothetical protein